jgi:hypothetical protein
MELNSLVFSMDEFAQTTLESKASNRLGLEIRRLSLVKLAQPTLDLKKLAPS